MDEKYTPYNHKGTKIDGVEPKHRGTPATKRGLSNQQICIITLTVRTLSAKFYGWISLFAILTHGYRRKRLDTQFRFR